MIDAPRSGSAGATTSDDVNGKDGTVEATRPVGSAYNRQASSRSGRRPTPYPDMNPDPRSLRKLVRHTANGATQSSEEGDVFEPLPASRKYFSRLADRKAPRNAEGVRIAAPKPPPQEHPYGLTSPLDARPSAEMMDSLAARIAADATQPLGDADIAASPPPSSPPTPPPRSPLRTTSSGRVRDRILSSAERRQSSTVTFAPGTNEAGPSNKKKKSRFDSTQSESAYYVPGGRKLSSDVSGSPGPAGSASDGSENVSGGSQKSTRSNPGQAALDVLRLITIPSTQRSPVSLGRSSSARARDGSRPTAGTDEVNPGTAVTNVLNMYPGNPARRTSRRSVTAIPKVADDLGVLPETYANEGAWPGLPRSRRPRTRSLEEVEELDDDGDDERSPTDTRAPRLPLPETLPSPRPDVVSQDDLALSNW
jgi:hypothetical protein